MDATNHPLHPCSSAAIEQYLAQGLCELTGHFAEVSLQSVQCSGPTQEYAGQATLRIRVSFRHIPEPEGEGPVALL
jgi:hypothetical protein